MLDEALIWFRSARCREPEARSSTGDDYVSSRDALRILQVKPQTLYSYVSRGLIRRRVKPGHRTSYYNREDIHRLKSRSVARSGHGPAAASAMYWGEPVLETAITEITPDGPRYRECLATDLARDNRSFESVAEYLWTGNWPSAARTWTNIAVPASLASEFGKIDPSDFRYVLTQSIVLLAKTWSCDPGVRELPCPATSVLGVMAGAFGFLGPKRKYVSLVNGETVAHGLARVLGISDISEERPSAERSSCPDGRSRIDDADIRRANFCVSGLRLAVVYFGCVASSFRVRI